MNTESRFTQEDLETRDAIWVVLRNEKWEFLIQDHIKLDFFTIPIWKLKPGENKEEKVKEEMQQEHGIEAQEIKILGTCEWIYDYDGIKIRIKTHIFEILSYTGTVTNAEPTKHRSIDFMSREKIAELPKISDATKFLLDFSLV